MTVFRVHPRVEYTLSGDVGYKVITVCNNRRLMVYCIPKEEEDGKRLSVDCSGAVFGEYHAACTLMTTL